MTTYHLAVCNYGTDTDDAVRAAVKIHGVFPTVSEARTAIHGWANEQTDVEAFVIEDLGRWIVVRAMTDVDAAEETEEIPTSQNDDPSQGRHGSVCNICKSTAAAAAHPPEEPRIQGSLDTPVTKKKAVQTQCLQLDERLSTQPDANRIRTDEAAYHNCRERYATLRAFERRLHALYAASLVKCQDAAQRIAALDEAHPTHRAQYRARYDEALRGSGIDPNEVSLMRFLGP